MIEENGYERVCRNISGRDASGPTDSWVKMKAIGDFGKPYYVVTEEYFNTVKASYEQDGILYASNLHKQAIAAFNQAGEAFKLLQKEIEDRAKQLHATSSFPAPGASAPSDPNDPHWLKDGSGPLRETA